MCSTGIIDFIVNNVCVGCVNERGPYGINNDNTGVNAFLGTSVADDLLSIERFTSAAHRGS
ncbi:hypothetical protein NTGM5_890041 [Candidatus Nitrotoga sp. M5]|jgi:hypothetical protein|nr:hypothetical protein NTGM5_890041 [Candidatus Nitrotoga sp. M5]